MSSLIFAGVDLHSCVASTESGFVLQYDDGDFFFFVKVCVVEQFQRTTCAVWQASRESHVLPFYEDKAQCLIVHACVPVYECTSQHSHRKN